MKSKAQRSQRERRAELVKNEYFIFGADIACVEGEWVSDSIVADSSKSKINNRHSSIVNQFLDRSGLVFRFDLRLMIVDF